MMRTAVVQNDELRAVVSAERGEIRSLVHRPTGAELLFQSPWTPAPSRPDLLDPEAWTRAWPGGWTLLFPNAGEPCTLDGRAHGFHGAASLASWTVTGEADDAVTLAWRDVSGLDVARSVRLHGDRLEVANRVVNRSSSEQPYLLVEHLILGERLAGPGATISVPPADVVRMDDAGVPLDHPEPWPTSGGWDRVPSDPFSRFGGLTPGEEPRVVVERDGLSVTVAWSGLPALWLWHEHRASDGFPGAHPITCLGVEPSTTVGSQGLAIERDRGEAAVLAPGAAAETLTALIVAPA
jgi:hypothetical protein